MFHQPSRDVITDSAQPLAFRKLRAVTTEPKCELQKGFVFLQTDTVPPTHPPLLEPSKGISAKLPFKAANSYKVKSCIFMTQHPH